MARAIADRWRHDARRLDANGEHLVRPRSWTRARCSTRRVGRRRHLRTRADQSCDRGLRLASRLPRARRFHSDRLGAGDRSTAAGAPHGGGDGIAIRQSRGACCADAGPRSRRGAARSGILENRRRLFLCLGRHRSTHYQPDPTARGSRTRAAKRCEYRGRHGYCGTRRTRRHRLYARSLRRASGSPDPAWTVCTRLPCADHARCIDLAHRHQRAVTGTRCSRRGRSCRLSHQPIFRHAVIW